VSNRKGTYYEIDRLAKRVEELERTLKEFMEQRNHKQPKPGYDIHGNKWPTDTTNEDNH